MKLMKLIVSTVFLIVFLWLFLKPLAYCFAAGVLVGLIIWAIKRLMTKD